MYKRRRRQVFPFLRDARRRRVDVLRAHEGRPVHHPHAGAARRGWSTCSTTSRWHDRDTNGDLYEYMLSKIATAGHQRPVPHPAPHHPADGRDDGARARPTRSATRPAARPASWSPPAEYVARAHPTVLTDAGSSGKHFHHSMFHGYDFDTTMLRIGSMNMLLHGVEKPDIRYRDSLSEGARRRGREVLADPGQPAVRGQPRLRVHVEGPAAGRQDQEDRTALPRPVPAAAQARRPRRRHRPRRRAVRLVARPTRTCAGSSSRTRSSTPSSSCPPASSSPYAGCPPRSCSSPRPTPAAPTRLVLRRPGRRLQPRRQAQRPLLPADHLGASRRIDAVRPSDQSLGPRRTTSRRPGPLAGADGKEGDRPRTDQSLLRPEGGHRRPGLRPLLQPV